MGLRTKIAKSLIVPLSLSALLTADVRAGGDENCTNKIRLKLAENGIGQTTIVHQRSGKTLSRTLVDSLSFPQNRIFAQEQVPTGYAVISNDIAPGDSLIFVPETSDDVTYRLKEWYTNPLRDFVITYNEASDINRSLRNQDASDNTTFHVVAEKKYARSCDGSKLSYEIQTTINLADGSGQTRAEAKVRDSGRPALQAPIDSTYASRAQRDEGDLSSSAPRNNGSSDLERRLDELQRELDTIRNEKTSPSNQGTDSRYDSSEDSVLVYEQRISELESSLREERKKLDLLYEKERKHDDAENRRPGRRPRVGRLNDTQDVSSQGSLPLRIGISFGTEVENRDESTKVGDNWQQTARSGVRLQGEYVAPEHRVGAVIDYWPGTGISVDEEHDNASKVNLANSWQLMAYGDKNLNISETAPFGLTGSLRFIWAGARTTASNTSPSYDYTESAEFTSNEFAGLGSLGLGLGHLDRGVRLEARVGGMLSLTSQEDRTRTEAGGAYHWWSPWDYGWLIWRDSETVVREQHTKSLKPFAEGKFRIDNLGWGVELDGFVSGVGRRRETGDAWGVNGEAWLKVAEGDYGRLSIAPRVGYSQVNVGIPGETDAKLDNVLLGIGLRVRSQP